MKKIIAAGLGVVAATAILGAGTASAGSLNMGDGGSFSNVSSGITHDEHMQEYHDPFQTCFYCNSLNNNGGSSLNMD